MANASPFTALNLADLLCDHVTVQDTLYTFPADGSGTKVWTTVFEDKPRGKFPGAKESCKVCAGPGADPMDWESVKAVIGAIGEKPSQAVERVLAERAGGYVVNGKAVWCETVARCILIDLARCEERNK